MTTRSVRGWFGLVLAVILGTSAFGTRECAAQDQSSFKFEFDYSEADENLFNDVVKAQIESAGAFLASYLGDSGTVTVKVVSKPGLAAFASSSTQEWETNDDNKAMPKVGAITFQERSLQEASQKKGGIFALTVHELGHILGFTEACKAFAAHAPNGQFTGDHVAKFHGGPVPLQGGHFPQGFKDKAGVGPRMCVGGGNTLSLLDLAVLADLGYSVKVADEMEQIAALGFKMPQGAAGYDRNGNPSLSGGEGNNVLVAGDGAWSLSGGPGDDILVAGNGDTVMYGRNSPSTPGKDTFYIGTAAGKHTIQNFGPDDVISVSPDFGIENFEEFLQDKEKVAPAKTANGMIFSGRFLIKLSDDVQITVQQKDFEDLKPSNFKAEAYSNE